MAPKFTIRPETPQDNQQVSHIVKTTFMHCERGYHGEAELVEKLKMSEGYIPSLSIVAEQNDQVVGHILLTRVYVNTGAHKVPTLILAPVSVFPEFQLKGIGSSLIEAAHQAALDLHERHIFLLGHAGYYPRFGYQPSRNFEITFPDGMNNDNCMAIELVDESLTDIKGELEYSQPFYEI